MLIASLSGCTQTRTVLYDKTLRPAKPKTYHIAIYDASSIQRPYKVIGIAISSAGPFHRVLDAINNLQDEARKMGGDALIDLSKGAPTSNKRHIVSSRGKRTSPEGSGNRRATF